MSSPTKKKLTYEETLSRTCRTMSLGYLVLLPLGIASVAWIARDEAPFNIIPVWLLIPLVLLLAAGVALIFGWLATRFMKWLTPTEVSADRMRLAIISIAILAILLSWLNWKDVPTNAQIDAVHNDPRFAAAIAEINDKHGNPELFIAALKNDHAYVSRYFIFALETLVIFIGLALLFGVYGIIYRILLRFWGPKNPASDETAR